MSADRFAERAPFTRRPGFDEIASGWGSDGPDDLDARLGLIDEYADEAGSLNAAELKVRAAMANRLLTLRTQ